MLNEKNTALAKYRIEQSEEFLNSAVKNLDMGELKTTNNRAYYSIFHAMRAVLALDEVDFKKHSGVIAYFRENYIKTKVFNKICSDIISRASLIRNKSDYDDFYVAVKSETIEQVENAKNFFTCIQSEGYNLKKSVHCEAKTPGCERIFYLVSFNLYPEVGRILF